jgi:hypothetical protein
MEYFACRKSLIKLSIIFLFLFISTASQYLKGQESPSFLQTLLPKIESWGLAESPQVFFPETLYEYIDGAAEIYLGYDFKGLIVGQYEKTDSKSSLSVEIYDMGMEKNAFGIYSAERFSDARFISIGNQGYLEEGSLNFLAGRYYIKLLCFECEEKSADYLILFSEAILERIQNKGQLPPILGVFPKDGLRPNSEKFILHNFMGYSFLHDGYLADYQMGDIEFDCFLIQGKGVEEAQDMLEQFIAAKGEENAERIKLGFHLRDRYYGHIYLANVKNYLTGVMKIKDSQEETGMEYLQALIQSLKKHIDQEL